MLGAMIARTVLIVTLIVGGLVAAVAPRQVGIVAAQDASNVSFTLNGQTNGPLAVRDGQVLPYTVALADTDRSLADYVLTAVISPPGGGVSALLFQIPSPDDGGAGNDYAGTYTVTAGAIAAMNGGASVVTVTLQNRFNGTALTTYFSPISDANQAPTLSVPSTILTTEDSDGTVVDVTVGDEFTPAANLTLTASGAVRGQVTFGGNGSARTLRYLPAPDAFGSDQFVVTVSDGARTTSQVVDVTITNVNDAPVIDPASIPAPITVGQTSAAGAVVTFPTPTATDRDGDAVTVTCVPASGSTFDRGTTTVTCTARDGNGGEDVETFTVTVTDQTAPVFTSLPNVTVGATSNYGAVVGYVLPTATDNAGTPTVSCLPAPGSQFPIGTTVVTCTASDGVNVTTGTFTVTVTNNGFRDPRDPRPGASPQTQPPTTPTPRPARPPRG